jgi:hypothetical protein
VIKLARTISADDKTYSELVSITAQLMQKAGEQISLSHTIRLAVALLKSCLLNYPMLEEEILSQISFEESNTKFTSIEEITSEWCDKQFLDCVFGIEQRRYSDDSGDPISELRKKGITQIFGRLKGERYEAELTEDSKIRTLHDGKEYESLSTAASAICGYPVNGWRWWRYLKGDSYCRLEDLRDGE